MDIRSEEEKWLGKVIYQIYPRSFQDSNNDGIGDIRGIINRLDYLRSNSPGSLNIDAIWLAPIFSSPLVDFGYDVSNYYEIHPQFGSKEDLVELINRAHQHGISIILDFIPNHTSNQHQWFLESRSSKENPYRNWYLWHDPKPNGEPPNNWQSRFGGSAWEFDQATGQYYLHSFMKEQPDLNWRNPEVIKEIQNVFLYWMNLGIDGFRVDSVNFLLKDDQYRDDPLSSEYKTGEDPYFKYEHIYSSDRPEVYSLLNELYQVVIDQKDKFIVSEAYTTPQNIRRLFQEINTRYHSPFNFDLIELPFDNHQFKKAIDSFQSALSDEDIPIYVLGNHDNSRVATRFGGIEQARLAAMLQLSLPGIPFIYYGEELGMEDTLIDDNLRVDPAGKELGIKELNRDSARTPMQWSKRSSAGFSSAKPWLPISKSVDIINVEDELRDYKSILHLYKKLIDLRHEDEVLKWGTYSAVKQDDIYTFIRQYNGKKNQVVLNFSSKEKVVNISEDSGILILTTHLDKIDECIDLSKVILRPFEGQIIALR